LNELGPSGCNCSLSFWNLFFIGLGKRFIGQRDTLYLKHFLCASIKLYVVLNDRRQTVAVYYGVILYPNCILCSTLKTFWF